MIILNSIIGLIVAVITTCAILFNYKKMMIFNSKKIISIILFLGLTFIIIVFKSILGYFNIITQIISGILSPITISLLIYIVFGKNKYRKQKNVQF